MERKIVCLCAISADGEHGRVKYITEWSVERGGKVGGGSFEDQTKAALIVFE